MPGRVSTSAALENPKCCFGSFFDAMSGTESDSHFRQFECKIYLRAVRR